MATAGPFNDLDMGGGCSGGRWGSGGCKGGQGSGSGWMLSLGILVAPMTNKWAKSKVGAVGQWEV